MVSPWHAGVGTVPDIGLQVTRGHVHQCCVGGQLRGKEDTTMLRPADWNNLQPRSIFELIQTRLTLFRTGLVDSTLYIVFSVMFCKRPANKSKGGSYRFQLKSQMVGVCDSPSEWSCSYTSCQGSFGRPGTEEPSSGRSWSPERTSGQALSQSCRIKWYEINLREHILQIQSFNPQQ